MQPFFSPSHFQHLPIRALSEKYRFISYLLATDALYFMFAASTEEIEPNAILLWLNHLAQTRSQLGILAIRHIALKDTILHPLTVRFEHLVNFCTSFIVGNIIGDRHKHQKLFEDEWWIFISFRHQIFAQEPSLNLEGFLIGTLFLQYWVFELRLLLLFVQP